MSKVSAVKRETYFTRVHKRWKRRDVVKIIETHPKYLFTQYIRYCLRSFLKNHPNKKIILEDPDFAEVIDQELVVDFNQIPIRFTSYAPAVFYSLRKKVGLSSEEYLGVVSPKDTDDVYLEFLSNSKSGQNFFLTSNKQFMIKTITKSEAIFFMKIMKRYFGHFESYPHSLLVKFIGLHSIKVKKLSKPVYFVVMLSIFYPGERITERYDIKGCQIGRYTEPPLEGSNVVVILKEKNLEGKSINLGTQREWFLKQIDIDSKFLQSIEVLDYSLLVGIQPLHKDEVQQSRKLSTVITRTQKSVSKSHSVTPQHRTALLGNGDLFSPTAAVEEFDDGPLPGMVDDLYSLKLPPSPSLSCSCDCRVSPHPGKSPRKREATRSHAMYCEHATLEPEEAQQQNRRLLPDYKNELHVLDGTERYFVGIIDFFTRFTLKKRLENAYKKLIYPPLSFSTVHPDVFADRFRKYWDKHTE
uniref:PIPK domain-containing protein n=1 Tax=Ciona savignyi TaxID=51511 RepID=H2YAR3_CIOSA